MKVLFLSRWFPYPADNGSKLRVYNLLRSLAPHHETTLLTFSDKPRTDSELAELSSVCQLIRVVPWQPYNPISLKARLGFFSMTPRSAVDTYSREMQRQLEQLLSSQKYDLIIASQWSMAGYSRYFHQVPALFEEVEVGLPYQQYAQSTSIRGRMRYGLSWMKHANYLAKLLNNYAACTVVSLNEKQLLSKIAPNYKAVEVIPNCINLSDYQAGARNPRPNTLIFTGSFRYQPNYEAMLWFLDEVFPLIVGQIPEVQLTITGDHADKPLPRVENVNLVGYVDDIQSLIASSWVSVVPLVVGGGTRLKILEAMAVYTPVVSTPKGAEGLNIRAGQDMLVADTPEAFAEAVIRLLREPGLHRKLAENAYQLVSSQYDWLNEAPRFIGLLEKVAGVNTARD